MCVCVDVFKRYASLASSIYVRAKISQLWKFYNKKYNFIIFFFTNTVIKQPSDGSFRFHCSGIYFRLMKGTLQQKQENVTVKDK